MPDIVSNRGGVGGKTIKAKFSKILNLLTQRGVGVISSKTPVN